PPRPTRLWTSLPGRKALRFLPSSNRSPRKRNRSLDGSRSKFRILKNRRAETRHGFRGLWCFLNAGVMENGLARCVQFEAVAPRLKSRDSPTGSRAEKRPTGRRSARGGRCHIRISRSLTWVHKLTRRRVDPTFRGQTKPDRPETFLGAAVRITSIL